jgi:hypothetical protein
VCESLRSGPQSYIYQLLVAARYYVCIYLCVKIFSMSDMNTDHMSQNKSILLNQNSSSTHSITTAPAPAPGPTPLTQSGSLSESDQKHATTTDSSDSVTVPVPVSGNVNESRVSIALTLDDIETELPKVQVSPEFQQRWNMQGHGESVYTCQPAHFSEYFYQWYVRNVAIFDGYFAAKFLAWIYDIHRYVTKSLDTHSNSLSVCSIQCNAVPHALYALLVLPLLVVIAMLVSMCLLPIGCLVDTIGILIYACLSVIDVPIVFVRSKGCVTTGQLENVLARFIFHANGVTNGHLKTVVTARNVYAIASSFCVFILLLYIEWRNYSGELEGRDYHWSLLLMMIQVVVSLGYLAAPVAINHDRVIRFYQQATVDAVHDQRKEIVEQMNKHLEQNTDNTASQLDQYDGNNMVLQHHAIGVHSTHRRTTVSIPTFKYRPRRAIVEGWSTKQFGVYMLELLMYMLAFAVFLPGFVLLMRLALRSKRLQDSLTLADYEMLQFLQLSFAGAFNVVIFELLLWLETGSGIMLESVWSEFIVLGVAGLLAAGFSMVAAAYHSKLDPDKHQ